MECLNQYRESRHLASQMRIILLFSVVVQISVFREKCCHTHTHTHRWVLTAVTSVRWIWHKSLQTAPKCILHTSLSCAPLTMSPAFFHFAIAEKFISQENPLRSLPNKPDWLLVTLRVTSLLLSLQVFGVIHLRLTRTRVTSKSYLSELSQIELLMKPRSELRDLEDQS